MLLDVVVRDQDGAEAAQNRVIAVQFRAQARLTTPGISELEGAVFSGGRLQGFCRVVAQRHCGAPGRIATLIGYFAAEGQCWRTTQHDVVAGEVCASGHHDAGSIDLLGCTGKPGGRGCGPLPAEPPPGAWVGVEDVLTGLDIGEHESAFTIEALSVLPFAPSGEQHDGRLGDRMALRIQHPAADSRLGNEEQVQAQWVGAGK